MYKRILSLFLCCAVALTSLFVPIGEELFTITASAEAAQDAPADPPELSGDPFELYGDGRFYYYQLTEPQKAMYDMMVELSVNDLTIEDTIYNYSPDNIDYDYSLAWLAFCYDLMPDWCSDMTYSYYEAGGDVYLTITAEPCHFYNEYLDQELNRKIDLMLENINSDYTAAQKVKAFLMLISDNAEYDSLAVDLFNNIIVSDDSKRDYYAWSVYGTLLFGEGVCVSYAKAFKKLANALGIPCVLVQSDTHMYNYVMLDDGKWYMIDATAETDPPHFLRGKNYPEELNELYGSAGKEYGARNVYEFLYPEVADKYYIAEGQDGKFSYDYIDVEIDTSIFAEETDDTIEFTYTPNDDGTCTITGSRGGGELNIPSEIDGYTVTEIADSALEGLKNRGKLTIPDTVTKIGKNAFYGCINLEGSLVIPDSVTEIGDSAFRACGFDGTLKLSENLTEISQEAFKDCASLEGDVVIPDNIEIIGSSAFENCYSITGVKLSNNLVTLGENAFGFCEKMTGDIAIPDTLLNYGSGVFWRCPNLNEFTIGDNPEFCLEDGVLYNKDKTILYACLAGKKAMPTIPDTVDTIKDCAFSWCENMTGTINIPDSVQFIGDYAFAYCSSLTGDLILSDNVISIGKGAFMEDRGLAGYKLKLSENLYSIGRAAFCNDGLVGELSIPQAVTEIGENTFAGNAFTGKLVLPDKLTEIGLYAFDHCQFDGELIIPGSVEYVGGSAFNCCDKLESVIVEDGVTSVDYWAFNFCESLKSVVLPKTVKTIGAMAFEGCTLLEDIELPDGLNGIGSGAFNNSGIKSITIPGTVRLLGEGAFYQCPNLASVEFMSGNNRLEIEQYTFRECKSLKDVILSDNVEMIGHQAFYDSAITKLVIPEGVTEIGDRAFALCGSLESAVIPESIKTIGYDCFDACSSLTGVKLPKSLTELPEGFFSGCGFTEFTIPNTITKIDEYAFNECDRLKQIIIPDSVTDIEGLAFSGCDSLETAVVSGGVETLKTDVFFFCTALKSVTLREGVKNIEPNAFNCCNSLKSLILPTSLEELNPDAITWEFVGCGWETDENGEKYYELPGEIYYTGTREQWKSVKDSSQFVNTVHFEYTPHKHIYNGEWSIEKEYPSVKTHRCEICGGGAKDPTTVEKISAVSGLKLKGRAADALRLSWAKNPSADGYIIERKDGSKWTRVAKITKNSTTEYRISGLKAGTTYNFRIKSYFMSSMGALYSSYISVSAKTDPTPAVVSGLKLKARAADALRITWAKNTSADGYIIEMKSGNTWTRVGKITNNSTVEFKKSKLKAGTAYTFRVKSYRMSGKTAYYSGYKSISARTNPTAVSGIKLKNSAKDAVRLSWTKNTSADGYIIEIKSGTKWVRVGKITKNSTVEFKKSGLKSKTSYTFRIKAYKMSGKTALYGAAKTITVKTK